MVDAYYFLKCTGRVRPSALHLWGTCAAIWLVAGVNFLLHFVTGLIGTIPLSFLAASMMAPSQLITGVRGL
jgi:hypothetical protein